MIMIVAGFGSTRQCVARLTGYAVAVRSCLAILVMLVACKDQDIERLTAIKDEMCVCKTASCAEQAMKRVPKDKIKSTPRTQAIAREMMGCLAKLQAAERPITDPDAEDGQAEPPDGVGSAPPAPTPR